MEKLFLVFSKRNYGWSLKIKFITSFAAIIIAMSAISITTYLTLTSTIGQMNTMIQNTILANNINYHAEEIIGILPGVIGSDDEALTKQINEDIGLIGNDLAALMKGISAEDTKGKEAFQTVQEIYKTFNENVDKVLKYSGEHKLAEAIAAKDSAFRVKDFMKNNMYDFIAIELNNNKSLQEKLNAETRLMGMLILLSMIVVGFLSILGAVIFSNNIANRITKLAKHAQSIADGNLQAAMAEVEARDDISILAGSFNKMSVNLRALIGKIGSSSEDVAHSADILKINAEQSNVAIEQVAASIQKVSQGASEQFEQAQETANIINDLYERNKLIYENAHHILDTSEKATNAANAGNEKMESLLGQIRVIEGKIIAAQTVQKLSRYGPARYKKSLIPLQILLLKPICWP